MEGFRTDLAAEELPQDGGGLPGVVSHNYDRDGFRVTHVEVVDPRGANALCKPIGTYITMELDAFFRREEDSFAHAVRLLADCLQQLLPLSADAGVLVAGLGNAAITPDAVGPETAAYTLDRKSVV